MRNTQNGYYTLNQRTVERSKQIFEKHGMKPFTAAHLKAWKDDVLNVCYRGDLYVLGYIFDVKGTLLEDDFFGRYLLVLKTCSQTTNVLVLDELFNSTGKVVMDVNLD